MDSRIYTGGGEYSFLPGWHGIPCTAEDNLELTMSLHLPSKPWDYKLAPSGLIYGILGMEPRFCEG